MGQAAVDTLEDDRLALQARLDCAKTPDQRNRAGQFATPPALARDLVRQGVSLLEDTETIRFLDPGFGTGVFYSALRPIVSMSRTVQATGFEIDPHYGAPAHALWSGTPLDLRLEDFTRADPASLPGGANLLICNPPYVRHHHLCRETKQRLRARTKEACGVEIGGLTGLYGYFMGLAHPWMAPGGVAGWLIPSEFMSVNYGRALKSYLLTKVTVLQVHCFDPVDAQFADALVSSAIVWLRNTPPPAGHTVRFTYGRTATRPVRERMVPAASLEGDMKWPRVPDAGRPATRPRTSLGDLFEIKRGLATGGNHFFVMDENQIQERRLPKTVFRPVLPGARHIRTDEIHTDEDGLPLLDRQLFLLDCRMPEAEIACCYPDLKIYLDSGGVGDQPIKGRYLCRKRKLWYTQEDRPSAPILCTYMGRGPFRFLLNHSRATALNTYLMFYPKPAASAVFQADPLALRAVWKALRAIEPAQLASQGRVYGGGLCKLEPGELRRFPADDLIASIPGLAMIVPQ